MSTLVEFLRAYLYYSNTVPNERNLLLIICKLGTTIYKQILYNIKCYLQLNDHGLHDHGYDLPHNEGGIGL